MFFSWQHERILNVKYWHSNYSFVNYNYFYLTFAVKFWGSEANFKPWHSRCISLLYLTEEKMRKENPGNKITCVVTQRGKAILLILSHWVMRSMKLAWYDLDLGLHFCVLFHTSSIWMNLYPFLGFVLALSERTLPVFRHVCNFVYRMSRICLG